MKIYPVNKALRPAVLQAELVAAGIAVLTVRASGMGQEDVIAASGEVVTSDTAVDAAVNAVIAAHDGTAGAAITAKNLQDRTLAVADLSDSSHQYKLQRSAVLLSLDQFNTLRQWDMSLKAAVAAATNFADLKTRIAALPALPDLTAVQVRNSMTSKINAGDADN